MSLSKEVASAIIEHENNRLKVLDDNKTKRYPQLTNSLQILLISTLSFAVLMKPLIGAVLLKQYEMSIFQKTLKLKLI